MKKTPALETERLTWNMKDGQKPRRSAAGLFVMRSPVALKIPPGVTATVDLGLTCSYPLLFLESRELRGKSLRMLESSKVFMDGDVLRIGLKNENDQLVTVGAGDPVATAFALTNAGIRDSES
jgi:hypothetical protein